MSLAEIQEQQWSEHPKFHTFVQKAASYVDNLGFSSPNKGQSETMHTLARKLDVQLETKKQPSKKILVEAIVITKLKQLDTIDAKNYTRVWCYATAWCLSTHGTQP